MNRRIEFALLDRAGSDPCKPVWIALFVAFCLGWASPTSAADDVNDLRWFDAESQTLRSNSRYALPPPDLSEPAPPRDWTWTPPNFGNRRRWNFSGLSEALATWLQVAAWVLLAAAALWFILFVLRNYRDLELGQRPKSDQSDAKGLIDIEKLADLPFVAPATDDDLLAAVRKKSQQGQYGDAIVLLFGYQLLALDKHQIIRILRGKTNRQYVREVARGGSQTRLRDLLTQTMVTFEDYFFGDHPVTRQKFEACWGKLDDFHAIVETTA